MNVSLLALSDKLVSAYLTIKENLKGLPHTYSSFLRVSHTINLT